MTDRANDADEARTFSVITPTLNAAAFLEQTLRSVSDQGRDDIEHIVVDGGSSDETLAIAARYPAVRIIASPGTKQSAAMNEGARAARGRFLVFLNADDVLMPGALDALSAACDAKPSCDVAYGRAEHIDEAGAKIEDYPTAPFDPAALLERCFICQAGTMMRRTAFERAGGFTASLEYTMDYDLWIRMREWAHFTYVDATIAQARLHQNAKTIAKRADIFRETFAMLISRAHYVPYSWTYAYADFRLQRSDGILAPRKRSRLKVLYAFALGIWINYRQPLRAVRDWLAHRR